MTKKKKECKS